MRLIEVPKSDIGKIGKLFVVERELENSYLVYIDEEDEPVQIED
ncbi:putative AAA+ superfamily ATPase [Bosea sp. OAE506]